MTTPFRVATFNANSIRVRLEQVLEWLRRYTPDVLCLQETKVQDQAFPAEAFRAEGWHVVYRGAKSYSGVALVSRAEPEDVSFGMGALPGDPLADEERLLRARVRGLPIVNSYVPQGRDITLPTYQYKLDFLARLRGLFERDYAPSEPLLWLGDFNVAPEPIDVHHPQAHVSDPDFHIAAREQLAWVREWGFVDLFRLHHPDEPGQFTYWDYRAKDPLASNNGWRVDHIYATAPLAACCTAAWIDVEARRAPRPSDHTFLVAELLLPD